MPSGVRQLLPGGAGATAPWWRRRRRIHVPVARVWVLNVLLAAGAVALLLVLAGTSAPASGVHVPWLLLAAAFAATELWVVHIHFRRGAQTFTLGEVPLVVGLIFATPAEVVLAWAIGAGLAMAVTTRLPVVRIAFNVAHFALVGGIACLVFRAVTGAEAPLGILWLAATLAVLAASTTSVALIGLAMTLSGERLSRHKLVEMVAMAWFVAVTNASLAVAVATVLHADPWAGLLLLPAAIAVFLAYRAYTEERAKHTSLEFLFDATRTLTRGNDATRGLAGLLAMAVETFRAESAEIALFPAGEDDAGSRVAVRGTGVETTPHVAPEMAAELQELVRDHAARVITRAEAGPALQAHLLRHGMERAMLAALPGDRGPLGAMLVADRVGVGDFGRSDLRLFETLSRQAASALGQDRLARRVRELRELSSELEQKAFHDPLTGLANRLLFMDRIQHAMSRRGGSLALIYIDLDDFKWVNDNLGHDAGDELLVGVSQRIRDSLRAEDTPARLGGDEFAVLLLDIAEQNARVVADRLLRAFERPLQVGGSERVVGASLGVAVAASGSMAAEQLVKNADVAMYVSKHGGKRGYTVYDSGMGPAGQAR
jgi:diguanylate cyclase (GGDEF)-like protein